jgi:hypothetical protein
MAKPALPGHRAPLRSSSAALALVLLGCAGRSALSLEDRQAVLHELRSTPTRYLAVSCVKAHLDAAPGTTFLLGAPLAEQPKPFPGTTSGILPAGTPVALVDIEFPGAEARLHRPVGSPRDEIWVRLGLPGGTTAVLPLPDSAHTLPDFWGELGQWVTRMDPGLQTNGWNDAVVEAVRERRVLVEMPAQALVAAWGPPASREVRFEAGGRRESWMWPGGSRTAELLDGKVLEARAPDASGTVP